MPARSIPAGTANRPTSSVAGEGGWNVGGGGRAMGGAGANAALGRSFSGDTASSSEGADVGCAGKRDVSGSPDRAADGGAASAPPLSSLNALTRARQNSPTS